MTDIVKPGHIHDETSQMPHPIFLGLMLIAAILAVAGAAVEGAAMRSAQSAWNKDVGDDIGLVFKTAGIASSRSHLLCLLKSC